MKLVAVTRPMLLLVAVLLATCVALGQDQEPGRRRRAARSPAADVAEVKPSAEFPDAPPGARITEEGWFVPVKPTRTVKRPDKVEHVFVIPIREVILDKTYDALRRKAIYARTHGTGQKLMVLDMDTWGGGAIAALDISRFLKADLGDIFTVCYVRTRAVSAGALIACACDEIVMTPVGTFGDCAPISMGGKLEGVEREKMETVLREEFAESAKLNGYNAALAESMVTITHEVWLIRNIKTRELRYVLAHDWEGKSVLGTDAADDAEWGHRLDRIVRRLDTGKADDESPTSSEWERVRIVVTDKQLLTMMPSKAEEYGFVEHITETPIESAPYAHLMNYYGFQGEPVVLRDTWSEKLVGFLMNPAVVALLFFLGIIGAYVEITTPGFGVPGTLAIVCFALVFGSRYLAGLALWWEIVLIVVGLILLGLEIFVIPGFGVAGVLGGLCLLVGIVGALIPQAPDKLPIPDTALAWDFFTSGVFALGIGFVCALIAMPVLSKFLPRIPVANRLVIAPSEAATDAPVSEASPMKHVRVGDVGVVEGMCRPVGKVRFGDALLDAMAEGDSIDRGARVRVTRREGNRLIVERVHES